MAALEQEIGVGVLNWPRYERVTDRYGSVFLAASLHGGPVPLAAPATGAHGQLVAVVLEARQSGHIGDVFRGFVPETPPVGEVIVLGEGTAFVEDNLIRLEPDDGRHADWLNPKALYRCHEQTVRLLFRPTPLNPSADMV